MESHLSDLKSIIEAIIYIVFNIIFFFWEIGGILKRVGWFLNQGMGIRGHSVWQDVFLNLYPPSKKK